MKPGILACVRRYVTRTEFLRVINALERQIMATQADVDAITAAVAQVSTDLDAARVSLQAEIDALVVANPAVDVTGLQAAVAPLDGAVKALGELKPTPPAPPA